MFSKIIVPIDLEHQDQIQKAVDLACNMASEHDAEVYFVSVTGILPSPIASSTGEYEDKVEAFAEHKAKQCSIKAHAVNIHSKDLAAELDKRLLDAVEEIGADLVVMASHVPGLMDHIFGTHGGHLAAHAKVSVFVVR